jgi:hypothetical protein
VCLFKIIPVIRQVRGYLALFAWHIFLINLLRKRNEILYLKGNAKKLTYELEINEIKKYAKQITLMRCGALVL